MTDPVSVLIEKISDAIGALPRVTKMRSKAEAEADVEGALIRKRGEVELRALERESLLQENAERIIERAIPQLGSGASPEGVHPDWITHFFQHCETVTDDSMQDLWARILAGEATSPGSYSRRTIAIVATIEKQDAEIFRNVQKFCVTLGADRVPLALVYDWTSPVYMKHGVTFGALDHMSYVGLVSFNPARELRMAGLCDNLRIAYGETAIEIDFSSQEEVEEFRTGFARLTQAGRELWSLSACETEPEFLDFLARRWTAEGLGVSTDS